MKELAAKTFCGSSCFPEVKLSPLPFLFHFNNPATSVTASHVNHFANDVAVWMQDADLKTPKKKLQLALDEFSKWSMRWKMEIAAKKVDCSFFSTNTHETSWRPSLHFNGQQLECNPSPKFLGVTFH